MKNKFIVFFLISVFLFFNSFIQIDNCKEKEKIYIVLDRKSPNINYRERVYSKNNIELTDLYYTLKSYGYKNDNIIEITFLHYDPQYNYSDFEMLAGVEFYKTKKNVAFLDSIQYVDEDYVINAGLEFEKKVMNGRVFILDKGTSKNDSLMMYEVLVEYTGFGE